MRQKKILFIATGGTFASIKSKNGLKPWFDVQELINLFPESKELAFIDGIQIANLDSTNVEPAYWTKIAECIEQNYAKYDAFIVSHGTDTMHYTSSALSYALKWIEKPVIITGSVLSPEEKKSDAKTNFIESICVAMSDNISWVFICFMGLVIHGNHARKINNEATRDCERNKKVFASINLPVVGVVSTRKFIKNQNCIYKSGPKHLDISPNNTFSPNIWYFNMIPGLDSSILDAFKDKKAILIETFWPGNIPFSYGNWLKKIEEFTKAWIWIFITTQNPFGEVDMEKYEVWQKAMKAGAIPCYDMTPEAALTKLMWLYGNPKNTQLEKVKKLFLTNVCWEIRESYL